jgi:hypothetical protein
MRNTRAARINPRRTFWIIAHQGEDKIRAVIAGRWNSVRSF